MVVRALCSDGRWAGPASSTIDLHAEGPSGGSREKKEELGLTPYVELLEDVINAELGEVLEVLEPHGHHTHSPGGSKEI